MGSQESEDMLSDTLDRIMIFEVEDVVGFANGGRGLPWFCSPSGSTSGASANAPTIMTTRITLIADLRIVPPSCDSTYIHWIYGDEFL